jgi:hypothetical protein
MTNVIALLGRNSEHDADTILQRVALAGAAVMFALAGTVWLWAILAQRYSLRPSGPALSRVSTDGE